MKKIAKALFITATLIFILGGISVGQADETNSTKKANLDNKNIMVMNLDYGKVFIKMRPDLAPNHVKRIKELVNSGFYDGHVFHRVIEGFMAQTGDPTGTGRGGSGQNIKAEFSDEPFIRGTLGMARSQHDDSADSQFFITFADSQFLNGKYTVFGEVVSGMEFIDKIKRGEPPRNPDKVLWMRVVSDKEAKLEAELDAPDFIDNDQKPKRNSK